MFIVRLDDDRDIADVFTDFQKIRVSFLSRKRKDIIFSRLFFRSINTVK